MDVLRPADSGRSRISPNCFLRSRDLPSRAATSEGAETAEGNRERGVVCANRGHG